MSVSLALLEFDVTGTKVDRSIDLLRATHLSDHRLERPSEGLLTNNALGDGCDGHSQAQQLRLHGEYAVLC